MINLDKYAYLNNMSKIHPAEKFSMALITLLLCVWANSIGISLAVLFTMFVLTVFIAKIPLKIYLKLILIPSYFLILGILAILFDFGDKNTLFIWNLNIFEFTVGITKNSLLTSVQLFFKALGAVSCLYFLTLTTSLIDIVSVLKKLKFPDLFLELVSLMYRFIFVLIDTAGIIYNAQSSRLGYSNIKNWHRSLGYLVTNLFINSFKRADNLFVALESRCYNGNINVLENSYKLSKYNIIFIILLELTLLSFSIYLKQIS